MDKNQGMLQTLLKNIETETNDSVRRKELLESLRTVVANCSSLVELMEAIGNASLDVLFESLASDDEGEISIICGILRNMMMVLNPSDTLQKYHDSILQGFQHPSGHVRALVVTQLQRCVDESNECVNHLCSEYQDLIIASINQLASDDLNTSKVAEIFLINLVKCSSGSEFLLGHAGIASFKTILNSPRTSETIKFRVYETLAHFGSFSKEHLKQIEEQHLLIQPLSELIFSSQDPLGQMNALEILSILAESKHGVDHIDKLGIFQKIQRFCVNWQADPLSGLFFPGVLKFIGKVGVTQVPPEELIDITIDALLQSEKEFALATVAIETLAFIGSTNEGKLILDHKSNLKPCFQRIQWLLSEAPTEFRCRILDALTILFGSGEDDGPKSLPKWFRIVFPQLSTLFSIVQHSFPEVRLSALNFLGSIAPFEWAQEFYLRIPGVVEFLIQRNIEPNKECGIAKFRIVTVVAKSPTAIKFLTAEDIGRLKIHVDQGLNFAYAQPILDLEGA